jgi:hypothetical protein
MFRRFFTVASNVSSLTFDPSNPLAAGIVAKMDRALEHVKQLDLWYDSWVASNPRTFTTEYNAKGGAKGVKLHLPNPVPITVGIILGDIVHNMRCALDHLAGAVAVKNSRSTKGVYFPIAPDVASLPAAVADKLRKCPQSFRDFVMGHQPYKGGNDALYALHQMDILDKHQVVIPSGVGADVHIWADNGLYGLIDFSKTSEPVKIPRPKGRSFVEDGETVAVFGPTCYFPDKTKVETRIATEVVFGDNTPVAGRELKAGLLWMMEAAEAVITQAEPMFLR